MSQSVNYKAVFEENGIYHIYNRSNNREILFKTDRHFQFFLDRLKVYITPYFHIGAYCLLPDHFHLMVEVKPIDEVIKQEIDNQKTRKSIEYLDGNIVYNDFLVAQFQRLFNSYAKAFNKDLNRHGSVFQKGFKRISLTEERIWYVLAYIHRNPIHHGLCEEYGEWKYCSYNAFFSSKPTLVARKRIFYLLKANGNNVVKTFLSHHKEFKDI